MQTTYDLRVHGDGSCGHRLYITPGEPSETTEKVVNLVNEHEYSSI